MGDMCLYVLFNSISVISGHQATKAPQLEQIIKIFSISIINTYAQLHMQHLVLGIGRNLGSKSKKKIFFWEGGGVAGGGGASVSEFF